MTCLYSKSFGLWSGDSLWSVNGTDVFAGTVLMLGLFCFPLIKIDENLIKNLTHSCKGEFDQKN